VHAAGLSLGGRHFDLVIPGSVSSSPLAQSLTLLLVASWQVFCGFLTPAHEV
jgi:hypothetical protein